MKNEALIMSWRHEEQIAHIHGWDFSHIQDRYAEEDDLPWDYRQVIETCLTKQTRLLDLDTGGGEFLLSLDHPRRQMAATEEYPPNVALCRERLLPLGVDFRPASAMGPLPFPAESFDMVINRHADLCPQEISRVLKKDGVLVTQQVGAENDRALVELLLQPAPPIPFPNNRLKPVAEKFERAGFEILRGEEAFRPIRFRDVGALVWFARVIPWEFPGFSVDACLDRLLLAQQILERDGVISGTIHRFLLVARKK